MRCFCERGVRDMPISEIQVARSKAECKKAQRVLAGADAVRLHAPRRRNSVTGEALYRDASRSTDEKAGGPSAPLGIPRTDFLSGTREAFV